MLLVIRIIISFITRSIIQVKLIEIIGHELTASGCNSLNKSKNRDRVNFSWAIEQIGLTISPNVLARADKVIK
jgi:hypothetical protein